MTDHPLTDKDIQSIWDKVGNDIVDAKDEDLDGFVEDDLIRTAYDLGADRQLEQVIKFMEEHEQMFGGSGMIFILKDAMRPQVVDLPQANSDVCGEEGVERARQQTFDENDELMRLLSDSWEES